MRNNNKWINFKIIRASNQPMKKPNNKSSSSLSRTPFSIIEEIIFKNQLIFKTSSAGAHPQSSSYIFFMSIFCITPPSTTQPISVFNLLLSSCLGMLMADLQMHFVGPLFCCRKWSALKLLPLNSSLQRMIQVELFCIESVMMRVAVEEWRMDKGFMQGWITTD